MDDEQRAELERRAREDAARDAERAPLTEEQRYAMLLLLAAAAGQDAGE